MFSLGKTDGKGENIDEFNRLTIFILDSLYEAFPTEALLKAEDFFEAPNDTNKFALDGTMLFLKREGFLHFRSSAGDGAIFLGVQLSMKGLELMNRTPDSLQSEVTVAEKIKSAIKVGTKEAFKEGVKLLISGSVS